jgi:hypothetical protein
VAQNEKKVNSYVENTAISLSSITVNNKSYENLGIYYLTIFPEHKFQTEHSLTLKCPLPKSRHTTVLM